MPGTKILLVFRQALDGSYQLRKLIELDFCSSSFRNFKSKVGYFKNLDVKAAFTVQESDGIYASDLRSDVKGH